MTDEDYTEEAKEDLFLIELSDEEFQFVTIEELREIDNSAKEFDGFTGVNVRCKIPKKALSDFTQKKVKEAVKETRKKWRETINDLFKANEQIQSLKQDKEDLQFKLQAADKDNERLTKENDKLSNTIFGEDGVTYKDLLRQKETELKELKEFAKSKQHPHWEAHPIYSDVYKDGKKIEDLTK